MTALRLYKGAVQPPVKGWTEEFVENQITYSEELDNAAWVKTNASISANAIADSQGELTADKIVENSATGLHGARSSSFIAADGPATAIAEVKAGERTKCDVWMINSAQTRGYGVRVDLTNGTFLSDRTVSTTTNKDYRIDDLGGGWYRVSVTCHPVTDTLKSCLVTPIADGTAASTSSYTGDGSSGIYVSRCQVLRGPKLGATYVKTTDAAIDSQRNRTEASSPWTPSATPADNNVIYLYKGAVQPTKITSSAFMDGVMTEEEWWRRRRIMKRQGYLTPYKI